MEQVRRFSAEAARLEAQSRTPVAMGIARQRVLKPAHEIGVRVITDVAMGVARQRVLKQE